MLEILLKVRNGDKAAFVQMVEAHSQQLYKIARTRLQSEHDVCDAMQNTLILAYQNSGKVKDLAYFKTWLVKILINECNKIYKKQKQNGTCFESVEFESLPQRENGFDFVESDLCFESMLKVLNFEERQAITLRYSSDFTIKEISKMIKANENTVKTRLARAKEKIKKHLEGGAKS